MSIRPWVPASPALRACFFSAIFPRLFFLIMFVKNRKYHSAKPPSRKHSRITDNGTQEKQLVKSISDDQNKNN